MRQSPDLLCQALPVERRAAEDLSYETFLRDYVSHNRPVVVSGAASSWPAVNKWKPEYFKTRFASLLVNVTYTQKMRFDDFIDAIMASTPENPGPYMFRFFICVHLPELLDDLMPANPFAFPRRLASPLMPKSWRRPDGYLKLLIGGPGGSFPFMHFDGEDMHAAITEIYGEKEFILYSPADTAYLYPKPDAPNSTQINDLEHPDLAKFPLFLRATQYRTVLTPGDTIFVPSRWWHTARVVTPSISVCANQVDESNWGGFIREVCMPRPGSNPVRLATKQVALRGLGSALSLLERLGRGSSIGRFAPWSIKEALPPGKWPISNWIVR
jgi:hypothetical protein